MDKIWDRNPVNTHV